MIKLPKKMLVFKRTIDDWCPNYNIESDARVSGLVEVSLLKLFDGDWRVCVWGADDLGMEKDFEKDFYPKAKDVAFDCFLTVIGMETVDMPQLKKLGFVYA